MTQKIWAKIRTQFEFTHCYPSAPESVSFLRNLHHHTFHVTVWVEQLHTERDIEYFLCKQWLDDSLRYATDPDGVFVSYTSCEAMAMWLAKRIHVDYGDRDVRVEITEDGTHGALVRMDSEEVNSDKT